MSADIDRYARFAPLGMRRNLLLDCLGGHTPQAPGYIGFGSGESIFEAFRSCIDVIGRFPAIASDPVIELLLAACRLLTGDLAAADDIVDNLPAAAPALRYGQRYCPLMPFRTLSAALPLPPELADPDRWIAGSPEQAALRAWLAENRDRLGWMETEGEYKLKG
jgi:hypothetical protein